MRRPVDDADSSVFPGSKTTWYRDTDGDGYAGSSTTIRTCDAAPGWYDTALDCDDGNVAVFSRRQ